MGKTYYFENELAPFIKNIHVFNEGRKKYRTVRVSLFGLKDISEVQSQIFIELYPILRSKKAKVSLKIAGLVARGVLNSTGLGNLDEYIGDSKSAASEMIDLKELVICFDDLERRSLNLPLEELIGFINSIVENNSAKIILIANEDKIEEKNYQFLKEKVIGITIDFIPDFDGIVKSLVRERYSQSFRSYSEFLVDNLEVLLTFLKVNQGNLRTLIYALDTFHEIYSKIKNAILDIPSQEKSPIVGREVMIMRFSLAMAIEFKHHKISYNSREDLDKAPFADWGQMFSKKKEANTEEIEVSFREEIIQKYFENSSEFQFFESIYSFVTGADEFDVELLKCEFSKLFNIANEASPERSILNSLNYRNCFRLDNKSYRNYTFQMIRFASEGKYQLKDYLTVFHFATRFENLLNLKISQLVEKLIEGSEKAKKHDSYEESLEMHFSIPENSPFESQLKDIAAHILKLNEELKEEKIALEASLLVGEFFTHRNIFIQEILNRDSKWIYTPVFNHANAHKFFVAINRGPNEALAELLDLFKKRYSKGLAHMMAKELEFFKTLELKLAPVSLVRKRKNLKNHLLNSMHSELLNIIDKLESAPLGL